MKIVVLGSTGMLGFALHRVLHDAGYEVIGTRRTSAGKPHAWEAGLRQVVVDDFTDPSGWVRTIPKLKPNVVLNAAGMIKQLGGAKRVDDLLRVNSVFPRQLATVAETCGFRLIHFSTDCVFQGMRGMYTESDIPDATDAYGVSKFLGEVSAPAALTIRTSLVGRGLVANPSLIDWFLSQTGDVSGYYKAVFSGLPVNEIARVTRDFLLPQLAALTGVFHLSSEPIDKYHLLALVKGEWRRSDIRLLRDARIVIDRSLDSSKLRRVTGYEPPNWQTLIREMRHFYNSLA